MTTRLLLIRVDEKHDLSQTNGEFVAEWPDLPMKMVMAFSPAGLQGQLIITDLAERSLNPLLETSEGRAAFAEAVQVPYKEGALSMVVVQTIGAPTVFDTEGLMGKVRWLRDKKLTAEQLDDLYNPEGNGEHPNFGRSQWMLSAGNGDTLLGYWEWVVHQLEEHEVY